MKFNWTLLPAALLVAMLALAGCGGSDSTPAEPEPTPEPMPDPGPSDLQQAADARAAAEAAHTMATATVTAAVEAAGKLSAAKVNGSSEMARANALVVLTATASVEMQLAAAKAAVDTLTALHAAATGDDKARIESMLMSATADHTAIQAILNAKGAKTLMQAVLDVKAYSTDTNAEIAQGKADVVARAVKTAIAALTTDATGNTFTDTAIVATSGNAPSGGVMYAGDPGLKFADIFGARTVSITKVADVTITDPLPANNTTASITATYKGIAGRLSCLSPACSVDGTSFAGDVVFSPSSAEFLYTPSGSSYTQVTDAAAYGYWMKGSAVELHVLSHTPDADVTVLDWAADPALGPNTVTATYTGTAEGYSERTTGTGDNEAHASGTFTADVELEATFGAAAADARLGGAITNFVGSGNHVNPRWYVTLDGGTTAANVASFNGSVTDANVANKDDATSGDWTANVYGTAGERPSGYVGAFTAGFADGSAAGVYQAD